MSEPDQANAEYAEALTRESKRLEACSFCGVEVVPTDLDAVRWAVVRGLPPEPGEDSWHDLEQWGERSVWAFCTWEHSTEWMQSGEVPADAWVRSVPTESTGGDIGCAIVGALIVLALLTLLGLGVLQAWQLLT